MVRIYSDPRCLAHVSPPGFPETPERLSTVVDGLRSAGFQIQEAGAHRSRETAIQEIHDSRYVSRFEESVRRGEDFLDSGDNPICDNTWEAASAAVDAALHAADYVSSVAGNKAMAAIRPPGHHAERGMAMGFCYFNNVAIAADYLKRSAGVERVAIVDFDVHHGNGTQHIFEQRQDVLYVSSHRHPFYPGTGLADEQGRGDGIGATVNVPLPAGSGDKVHASAYREIILPSLRKFSPDILLISAGFDSWINDPLGGMKVTETGFRDWGSWLGGIAEQFCEGRVLVVLEGGYDVASLPSLVKASLEGLTGG
jgi:acetoin utilization deacetylase AcuC-like enzyme